MAKKQPPKTRDEKIDAFLLDWKGNYVRWAIMFFLGLSIYRTTTDGLWFIAFVAISFAYNLESHVKSGTPLIREKKYNQTIREYGVGRAISTLIFPIIAIDLSAELRRISYLQPNLMYIWIGRTINTLLFLHLYVILIILFDLIDTDLLRSLVIQSNQPFEPIIDIWYGLRRSTSTLRYHAYSELVPVLEHIHIVTLLAFSINFFGTVLYVLKPEFYQGWKNYFASEKNKFDRMKIKRFGVEAMASPFGRLIAGIIMTLVGAWAFCYLFEIPLYFEGEPHKRYGKYVWMYSYMYKDYLGYFTPTYYLGLFFLGIVYGIMHILEIPCRCWTYLLTKLTSKKSK